MPYEARKIDARWQRRWLEEKTFRTSIDPSRPKFYVLDMFPYPSGSGLHVGHAEDYTATDVISRYKRMRGCNVLHPMGWRWKNRPVLPPEMTPAPLSLTQHRFLSLHVLPQQICIRWKCVGTGSFAPCFYEFVE